MKASALARVCDKAKSDADVNDHTDLSVIMLVVEVGKSEWFHVMLSISNYMFVG
jgi:hypothetical protein